jgi:hypothetical protein
MNGEDLGIDIGQNSWTVWYLYATPNSLVGGIRKPRERWGELEGRIFKINNSPTAMVCELRRTLFPDPSVQWGGARHRRMDGEDAGFEMVQNSSTVSCIVPTTC